MVDFVERVVKASTVTIKTAAEARSFKDESADGAAILALFDDAHDKRLRAFEAASVSSLDGGINWGVIEDPNTRGIHSIFGIPKSTSNTIISFPPRFVTDVSHLPVKFGAAKYGGIVYEGDSKNHEDISFWASQTAVPMVATIESEDMYERVFEASIFDVMIVVSHATEDMSDISEETIEILRKEALKTHKEGLEQYNSDKLLHPTVRVVRFHPGSPEVEHLQAYDIDPSIPEICIVEQHMIEEEALLSSDDPDEEMNFDEQVYHFDGNLDGKADDVEYLQKWLGAFRAGELMPGESGLDEEAEEEFEDEYGNNVPAPVH